MKIFDAEVTQADIDLGGVRKPESCPIALAANRVLKDNGFEGRVRVYLNTVVFETTDGSRFWIETSGSQHKFVKKFDKGRKVKPFTFALYLPEGSSDPSVKSVIRSPDMSR